VVARYEVANHDKDGELVHLGESSRGTPVWINRTVAEADVRIAVGNVCAHPIAGYGGGAKIVVPGVAGRETIHLNHSLADDPNVTIGCADGNPVREDMEEIARMAGLDMIVNTILSPRKKIVDVVAGDVVAAHREGVRRYCARYGVEVKEEADVGVVGASPRDASFGHATFALYAALPMVRRGGTVILVAPCAEGAGTREDRVGFREKASLAPEELMKLIRSGEVDASGGAFDYVYAKALNNYRVALVSENYSRVEAEEMGLVPAESLQQAVDEALAAAGREATVSVMPVGGLTVPVGSGGA
jgi:nickel-dependent lactate racemase